MKTVLVNEQGYISLLDLIKGTDVNKKDVYFYDIFKNKNGTLTILLFDKNKNQIKVKEKK